MNCFTYQLISAVFFSVFCIIATQSNVFFSSVYAVKSQILSTLCVAVEVFCLKWINKSSFSWAFCCLVFLHNPSMNSDMLEKLADAIFHYIVSPIGLQIVGFVEAWTLHVWDRKWLEGMIYHVLSLERKAPDKKSPAQNCKRRVEMNYLPPHPSDEAATGDWEAAAS